MHRLQAPHPTLPGVRRTVPRGLMGQASWRRPVPPGLDSCISSRANPKFPVRPKIGKRVGNLTSATAATTRIAADRRIGKNLAASKNEPSR